MASSGRSHRSLSSRRHRQLSRLTRADSSVPSSPQQQQQQTSASRSYMTRCLRSEIEAEDALFQQIELLIHRFLSRPHRSLPYHTVIRWSGNPEINPDYTVMIRIDQPSRTN